MIGQLINTFEALPEQTIKTFNEVFKCSPILGYWIGSDEELELVPYEPNQTVTIGELFSNVRQIMIDNDPTQVFYHELKPIGEVEETSDEIGQGNSKKIRLYDANKKFIGNFNSIKAAYFHLGLSQKQFSYRVTIGKLIMEEVGTCN